MYKIKKVVILGRTNVGKSTLFNRLIGKKISIEYNVAGITRDFQEALCVLKDLNFILVDTAGFEGFNNGGLEKDILLHSKKIAKQADLVLFMVNLKEGLFSIEEDFLSYVRSLNKIIILVINKCDEVSQYKFLSEFYKLGLNIIITISASHNTGLNNLYYVIRSYLSPINMKINNKINKSINLVILGRSNVGKSTFINSILDDNRVLTGDIAGITRDIVNINLDYNNRSIILSDTAGLDKVSLTKIKKNSLEDIIFKNTLRLIKLSNIIFFIFDINNIFEKQNFLFLRLIIKSGRGLVLGINKWDKVPMNKRFNLIREIKLKLKRSLPQVSGIFILPFSAKYKEGINNVMNRLLEVYDLCNVYINTALLNKWLKSAIYIHTTPNLFNKVSLKLKYITQISVYPPTFVIFSNKSGKLPENYNRYLINSLRKRFKLPGVPIKIILKCSDNPYT